ncbi:MAG TPA: chemotaxis response regulator protein-glutamate methylesterase [Stellaceae bacterium]|jgi:two-component system chemotaxis response regulator CheB
MLHPYRVMIVDDSAVIRGLLARTMEAEPDISVVTTASDGRMAVNALGRYDVEVIVLDIEMPVMDGLTALPLLIEAKPGVQVIVASTLTRRGADISLQALAAGAADYLTKPTASALSAAADFRRDLVAKVRALASARRGTTHEPAPAPAPPSAATAARNGPAAAASPAIGRSGTAARSGAPALRPGTAPARERAPLVLRPAAAAVAPEVLAIGSSTGGPQALFTLLGALRNGGLNHLPVLVTQHMPATFTTILAEHIGRATGWPAAEAVDGEPVRPGRVYIAPGDFHMVVVQNGAARTLRLNKEAPENFCRPSVDPMLRSIAQSYGRHALCAILTGMGHDGLGGGRAIVAAGGTMIAQDEATSVVWGMPGAVATAGLCSAVLPLPEIAPYIRRVALRSAA